MTSAQIQTDGGPPLLGVPVTVGPRRTTPLTAEHFGLFNTFSTTTRADRRRRSNEAPPNTPVPSEDASPRIGNDPTRPIVPDINQVD